MKSHPRMWCRACAGTGRVPLPAELLRTLDLVRKGPITAPQLFKRIGSGSPTTANNRLQGLRALGFVQRRKVGRTWVYEAVGSKAAS